MGQKNTCGYNCNLIYKSCSPCQAGNGKISGDCGNNSTASPQGKVFRKVFYFHTETRRHKRGAESIPSRDASLGRKEPPPNTTRIQSAMRPQSSGKGTVVAHSQQSCSLLQRVCNKGHRSQRTNTARPFHPRLPPMGVPNQVTRPVCTGRQNIPTGEEGRFSRRDNRNVNQLFMALS